MRRSVQQWRINTVSPSTWTVDAATSSSSARHAHENGQLDLMWEYTGVSLVAYNHVTEGERNQRIKLRAAPWGLNKLLRRSAKHTMWLAISVLARSASAC